MTKKFFVLVLVLLISTVAQADLVETRARFFGAGNVDSKTGTVREDRVILSWFGASSFAASIGGHVVLLDAWVPRGLYSGYVPTSVEEIVKLKPEAIFLGHGHVDHGSDLPYLLKHTGAKLVASQNICARFKNTPCVAATGKDPRFGEVRRLDEVLDGVEITAVVHPHSAPTLWDTTDRGGAHWPVLVPPALDTIFKYPPSAKDLMHLFRHLLDESGPLVMFQFKVGSFALTWHDSSGPVKDVAPHVADVFRSLAPTTVEVGPAIGFNQVTNGLRDQRLYIEWLKPKYFVPTNHDFWFPPLSGHAKDIEPQFLRELERLPKDFARPELILIRDPHDYVDPTRLTFDLN